MRATDQSCEPDEPQHADAVRDDSSLLAAARAGDPAAFTLVADRHRTAGETFAARLVAAEEAPALVSRALDRMELALMRDGETAVPFRPRLLQEVRGLRHGPEGADEGPQGAASSQWSAFSQVFAALPEESRGLLWHGSVEHDDPADVARFTGVLAEEVTGAVAHCRTRLRDDFFQHHVASVAGPDCRRSMMAAVAEDRPGLPSAEHRAGCTGCRGLERDLAMLEQRLGWVVATVVLGAHALVYLKPATPGAGKTAAPAAAPLADPEGGGGEVPQHTATTVPAALLRPETSGPTLARPLGPAAVVGGAGPVPGPVPAALVPAVTLPAPAALAAGPAGPRHRGAAAGGNWALAVLAGVAASVVVAVGTTVVLDGENPSQPSPGATAAERRPAPEPGPRDPAPVVAGEHLVLAEQATPRRAAGSGGSSGVAGTGTPEGARRTAGEAAPAPSGDVQGAQARPAAAGGSTGSTGATTGGGSGTGTSQSGGSAPAPSSGGGGTAPAGGGGTAPTDGGGNTGGDVPAQQGGGQQGGGPPEHAQNEGAPAQDAPQGGGPPDHVEPGGPGAAR